MSELSAYQPIWQPHFLRTLDKEPEVKLNLHVAKKDGVTVIHSRGRIVYRDEAAALSAAVVENLPQHGHLVIELSGVEMIDSAGLGELLAVYHITRARNGSLKLAAVRPHVMQLLHLTNLDSVFDTCSSLEEAIASLQAPPAGSGAYDLEDPSARAESDTYQDVPGPPSPPL